MAPRYKVLRKFSFPYGHRLSKHKGLCKNIHGHNWGLEVQVSSSELDENDMVIDFSDLKKGVNTLICDKFDHAIILNSDDIETWKHVKEIQEPDRIILMDKCDPTAEKITENIFYIIREYLNKFERKIDLDYIRIWENDKSMAEFSDN